MVGICSGPCSTKNMLQAVKIKTCYSLLKKVCLISVFPFCVLYIKDGKRKDSRVCFMMTELIVVKR